MFYLFIVATQEKAIHDIEGFDKAKLRKSDTTEKQTLPNTDGKIRFHFPILAFIDFDSNNKKREEIFVSQTCTST